MFSKKRGGKSIMKLFIEQWIDLFKEAGQELGKLWSRYFPKFCKCKDAKKK